MAHDHKGCKQALQSAWHVLFAAVLYIYAPFDYGYSRSFCPVVHRENGADYGNQTVAGFQLLIANSPGQDFTAAIDRQHADTVSRAQAGIAYGLPDQARARWNHDL